MARVAAMYVIATAFAFAVLTITSSLGLTDFETNYSRTLSPLKINPGCNLKQCTDTNFTGGHIAYVTAKGTNDTIHHIFSTVGAPAILMSRISQDASLNINYSALFDGEGEAIKYTLTPDHSFGLIFCSLYEFNDTNDEANLTSPNVVPTLTRKYPLTNLTWQHEVLNNTDGSVEVVVNATASGSSPLFFENGYLSFRVRFDPKDGRLDLRPHMELTANSTSITVVMGNLNSTYNASRFAIEMIMFNTGDTAEETNSTQVLTVQSLDDEYSPGVFEMRTWQANSSKPREAAWGYAQWKPVMYTSTDRRNQDLSHATAYPNAPFNRTTVLDNFLPNRSIFYAYFGNNTSQVSLNATNISFGATGDKFYAATNYLVWTLNVGLGPPPTDDVSILVILVIAVGLGIPLIGMIGGGIFVCVKNRRRDSYDSIN